MIKLTNILKEVKTDVMLNQILDKINKDGMQSLTFKEKKFLNDYSQDKASDMGDVKILPFSKHSLRYSAQITLQPYDNKIHPNLIIKQIKDILEKNNIDAEIGYVFLMHFGYYYFIKLDDGYDFNIKKVIDLMNKGGKFKSEENPEYEFKPESRKVSPKVLNAVENPDIIVSLNSDDLKKLKLSVDQHITRLSKILNKNNIKNFVIIDDKNKLKLKITSNDTSINDVNSILKKSGYDTIIIKQND